MKKIIKRVVSLLLALVLIAGVAPEVSVTADAIASGPDDHGFVLSISGGVCAVCKKGADVTSVVIDHVEVNGDTAKIRYYYGREAHGDCWPYTDYITLEVDNFSCTADYFKNVQHAGKYEPGITVRRSGGHTVSEWTFHNGTHTGSCNVCKETVTGICSGTQPTCTDPGICNTCANAYLPIDPNGHTLYQGEKGNGTHSYSCGLCLQSFTENCSAEGGYGFGAAATCSSRGICDTCASPFGEVDPQAHEYEWVSDGRQHWQVCKGNAAHVTQKTDCSLQYAYTSVPGNEIRCVEYCASEPACGHSSIAYVFLDAAEYTYTGSAITPARVRDGAGWIHKTKYQPSYADNTYVGEAKLALGIHELAFQIVPYDISGGQIAVEFMPAVGTYNGQKQEPDYSVKFNGTVLTAGVDYDAVWNGDLTNAGWNTLMITGKGNFTGTRLADYEIGKTVPVVTAPLGKDLVYNGTEQALVKPGDTSRGTMVYSLNESGPYTLDIPTGTDAGTYTLWYQADVGADPNYRNTEPLCVEVTIGKAPLLPVITGTASKIYDGNTDVVESQGLAISAEGILKGEKVDFTASFAFGDADAGENKIVCASDIHILGEDAGNYQLVTDAASAPVGRIEPLTLTEKAVITVLPLIWNGTEQTAQVTSVRQKDLDVTYELSGNSASAVGAYQMMVTGTGNFQGNLEAAFCILPDEEILHGIAQSNVTSDHEEVIRKAKEMAETANTGNLPKDEKTAADAALEEILRKVEELEKRLDDAGSAAKTEAIITAAGVTGENAKASDKQVLKEARNDLESALNTYAPNYTKDEQKAMNREIERLEEILGDIAGAEAVIGAVEELPETAAADEADVWENVDKAQNAYDALPEAQKRIVDNSTGGKLAKLQAARYDVRLTNISTRTWYKKGGKNLVLTFNGPAENFSHLIFGTKQVPAEYISVKSGSTVITLSPSFLTEEKIASGKAYKITAVYNFGKDDAGEDILVECSTDTQGKHTEVVVKTSSSNADTGDLFQVGLWAGIGGISLLLLIAILILMRKKEQK